MCLKTFPPCMMKRMAFDTGIWDLDAAIQAQVVWRHWCLGQNKGKIMDATCNGTPVVTTNIGAEGMSGLAITASTEDDLYRIPRSLLESKLWEGNNNRPFMFLSTIFKSNFQQSFWYNNLIQKFKDFPVKIISLGNFAAPISSNQIPFGNGLSWKNKNRR